MIVPFQIFVCVMAVIFGAYALPRLYRFIIIHLSFNATKAHLLAEQREFQRVKKMKASSAFQNRLNDILDLIQSDVEAGKKSLEIAFLHDCDFDVKLKEELEERGFTARQRHDRMMVISWE